MGIIFGIIFFSCVIGFFIGIVTLPFTLKSAGCPVCDHKITYVRYHAGKTCPACRTRLVIRKGQLQQVGTKLSNFQ